MDLQKRIYKISEMLMVFMSSILLITAVFFACGISIGYANFFLPIIFMFFFRLRFLGGREYFITDCTVSMIVLVLFILFSAGTFDNTWDGAAYHKTAVGLLKEGWNPFYIGADSYNTISHSIEPARDNPLLWAETYPKATWYYASSVYFLTGNIECGKSYTLVFAFITFGSCVEYFSRKTKKKSAYVLSAVAALNPIVCSQFQTYYLDGVVACVLTLLIIKFLDLLDSGCGEYYTVKQVSIFGLILWGCNVKFNVMLYVATICVVYCVCLCIRNKKIEIKRTIILGMQGIVSIFLIGAAPYITNIIRHGSIFYGFTNILEEISHRDFNIAGLNHAQRFWASVFGRTSHGEYTSVNELLKIPFTFNKAELDWYKIPDIRIGGFGILFSGLFLISMLMIIITTILKIKNKEWNIRHTYISAILIISIVEFSLIPMTFQFRYIPHFYLIIVYALYCIIKGTQHAFAERTAFYVFLTAIIINIIPGGGVALERIKDGTQTSGVLHYMESTSEIKNITYNVAFWCDDFTGMFYNLKDYNINYLYTNINDIGEDFQITFANWLYYKELSD